MPSSQEALIQSVNDLTEAIHALLKRTRPSVDPNGLVDTETAARMLKMHRRSIESMMRKHELTWVQRGSGRFVLVSSIHALLRKEAGQAVWEETPEVIKHANKRRQKREDDFSDLGV